MDYSSTQILKRKIPFDLIIVFLKVFGTHDFGQLLILN